MNVRTDRDDDVNGRRMWDQDPTVRSRELGRLLSAAMDVDGMTQSALAGELGWSPGMVSRMITGKRPVSAEQMAAVLGVLRITGEKRQYAMTIARRATERGWLREVGDRQPAPGTRRTDSPHEEAPGPRNPEHEIWASTQTAATSATAATSVGEIPGREVLWALEDAAAAVVAYEPNYVPDVLRTAEYLTATITAGPTTPTDEISTHVQGRLARNHDFLDRTEPANLQVFIDEYTLCRTGAGREVMSTQVRHLLGLSVRPNITIRVVPETTGFHAGTKGGFQLVVLKDGTSVVCAENETSIVFLERQETILAHQGIIDQLSTIALDETHTRTWLSNLAARLDTQPDVNDLNHGDTPKARPQLDQ